MTAQCSGGISAPLPGAQLTVAVGSAYIAQLLEETGLRPLKAVAPLFTIPFLALSNFCGNDPPACPVFTAAEYDAITQIQFTPDYFTGLPKAIQLVERLVWFSQCFCETGTMLPQADCGNPPAGSHVEIPLRPTVPGSCHHENPTFQNSAGDNFGLQFFAIPAGLSESFTRMQVNQLIDYAVAGTLSITWHFVFVVNHDTLNLVTTPTQSFTSGTLNNTVLFDVPVGTTDIGWQVTVGTGTGTLSIEWNTDWFCGSGPGPQAPCCPPDPVTQANFDAIMNLLAKVLSQQVTPRLPLYADHLTHTGVTGSGTVIIGQKSIAFRVDVTSDLSGWPQNVQVPTYYFSLGFMTSLAVGTPIKGWRLVYQSQTYPLAAECDEVAYTLPPGVVANITELIEVVQP